MSITILLPVYGPIVDCTALSNPYPAAVLTDSPTGYWRLCETSGVTANDVSGNGYHGTYENSPVLGSASLLVGDIDKSVTFVVGPEDRVDISVLDALFNVGSGFSVEFWFKSNYATAWTPIGVTNSNDSPTDQIFRLDMNENSSFADATGNVNIYFRDRSNNKLQLSVNSDLGFSDNNPHHVVWTYPGSGNTSTFYLDGSSVATTPIITDNPSNFTVPEHPLKMGAWNNRTTIEQHYNGVLDEFAVWIGTVLNSTQVSNHYNAGI